MLDSLGSTLTRSTVASFFTHYSKKPHEDEISMEQAVMCLEAELGRPDSEKKRLDADDAMNDSSVSTTPVMFVAGQCGEEVPLDLDKLDSISGPPHVALETTAPEDKLSAPTAPRYVTEPIQMPLTEETPDTSSDDAEDSSSGVTSANNTPGGGSTAISAAKETKEMRFKRIRKTKDTSEDFNTASTTDSNPIERLINIKKLPSTSSFPAQFKSGD